MQTTKRVEGTLYVCVRLGVDSSVRDMKISSQQKQDRSFTRTKKILNKLHTDQTIEVKPNTCMVCHFTVIYIQGTQILMWTLNAEGFG